MEGQKVIVILIMFVGYLICYPAIRLFRRYLQCDSLTTTLITGLRCKPVGIALLLLCTAIFANGVASARVISLSRPTDPCFIPPHAHTQPIQCSNGQPVQVKIGILLIDVVEHR